MTRRMTLIVLALVGLMVLVVTVSPPDSAVEDRATPTPTPAGASLSDPNAFDVTETLSTAPGAEVRTIDAEVGDRIEIVVEGDGFDSVLLGELESRNVEAGIPARFELLADAPGAYPLVLTNSNRRIGTLQIR
jgi:hypothetical protein